MTGALSHCLTADAILMGIRPARIGRKVVVLEEIESTNSYSLDQIAARGAESDGHVVFAEYQTAGRGRLGRSWLCPRGAGVMFTAMIWERPAGLSVTRLIMATALAVARGIEAATDVASVIRWPNDIFVKTKKVAGILVEARPDGDGPMPVAIGVGINCLQHRDHFAEDLRDQATSLEMESRRPIDRVEVARAVLRELDEMLGPVTRWTDEALAAAWLERIGDIGERVAVKADGRTYTGHVLDVHPQTGLIIQLDSGTRRQFDLATVSRA